MMGTSITFSINFGDLNESLNNLSTITPFDEPWNASQDCSILFRYLKYWWKIVVAQDMLFYSNSGELAAFNTGLVTPDWDEIYALLTPNTGNNYPQTWKLLEWATYGQGKGKLLANFSCLPQKPVLYSDYSELYFDAHKSMPSFDFNHILNRLNRLPDKLLYTLEGPSFPYVVTDGELYYNALKDHIESDKLLTNILRSILENSVRNAFKRVKIDPFCAAPCYYPTTNDVCFLLPLAICSSDADCCLVLKKGDGESYIGATILSLKDGFSNARLIGRFSSSWLNSSIYNI